MTSPAAVVGLRVNGFDVQRADLGIFLDLMEGLDEFPQVRGEDDIVPFMTGTLMGGRTADSRKVLLGGFIRSDRGDGVRAFFNELKRSVDPTTPSRITVQAIVEDGATWTILARPASLVSNAVLPAFHNVSLELDAEPYWRREWGGSWLLDSGLYMDDSSFTLDMPDGEIDVTPTTDPFDVEFNALGTSPIRDAVVSIYGPSSGAVGIRLTNLGQVGFTYPALTGGQVLIVDTGNRSVTLAGVNKRSLLTLLASNTRGEYFRIAAGINTLRITGHPARVTLPFSSCY